MLANFEGLQAMPAAPIPGDGLAVKTAAERLGVGQPTLRGWDAPGKFGPRRRPMDRDRLDRRSEPAVVLRSAARRGRDDG
jgi:hypothetical protein